MPITLSVSSPAASKAPAASPAAAFSAQPAAVPASSAVAGKDAADKASQSANAANHPNQTNAADANANAQTSSSSAQVTPDAFSRMLDAQMGTLEGSQLGGAVGTDSAEDGKPTKPTKSSQATITANDPLPNPALLMAQVPVQPLPSVVPTSTGETNTQASTQSAANAAALNPLDALHQANDSQAAASKTDKTDGLFAGLLAQTDSGLQKLPPQEGPQSTNLPQQMLLQANQSAPTSLRDTPTFSIAQPVGTPAWTKSLAEQMQGMVTIKAETAHIQLNPPELGPIDITLKMDAHNTAQVTFNADSAATRQALQDSLPRLHSMMAASGIQLGDAQVSSGQSQAQQQNQRNPRGSQSNAPLETEEVDTLSSIKAARDMLSIFA